MSFHTDEPFCPGCTRVLKGCHPDLEYYFYRIKDEYPKTHISDGFRSKSQQDECVARKTTRVEWPHSKHNKQDSGGNQRSEAMDLFHRDDVGIARWERDYFEKIALYLKDIDAPIRWGGDFKRPDFPHYELK